MAVKKYGIKIVNNKRYYKKNINNFIKIIKFISCINMCR